MSMRGKDETWLEANECAARIGLSKRALRLYEEHGLIRPRRTPKGWRLYGPGEIARLHEVLALKRIDEAAAKRQAAAIAERVRSGTPHPRSEPTLRRLIEEQQRGAPCLELMSEELATLVREQLPVVAAELESRGPLRALGLRRVGPDGADVYTAEFAKGAMECGIGIAGDGKVHTLWMLPA
jgi:DNA-binding transcriptional MerR regulator